MLFFTSFSTKGQVDQPVPISANYLLPAAQRLLQALLLLIALLLSGVKGWGQTTYDWLNTAPDGNWRQGAFGARWNPGGLFDEPPYGILRFNNNHQLSMTNNVSSTYNQHAIIFGSFNTSNRSISGNTVQFADFSGTWPRIRNESSGSHTIGFPIIIGSGGTWNMEFIANAGPISFTNTVTNNNGKGIMVYGNNTAIDAISRFISFGGVVSGNGFVNISQFGAARFSTAHTYTGQTQIDNGELWIESGGSINSGSGIFVGNGVQLNNVTKLWLSNSSGGTTFSNNFTVNNGNTDTREIGGLNSSGTHTFSGTITNSSNTGGLNLRAVNSGGVTNFSGTLTGNNPFFVLGSGIVQIGGNNNFTSAITVRSGGTLRLGGAGSGSNTPLGTIGSGTTVSSGGVLDLNGFTLATAEALTLNGTGILSGGALVNNTGTAVSWSGGITLGSASNIGGSGQITISGAISGGNALTKVGSNTVILTGANTYTGLTTVSAGTLQLNRSGGTTIPAANDVTIDGGTLLISTDQTIRNLTLTSGVLQVASGVTLTITGTYTGNAGTINNLGTIRIEGTTGQNFPGATVAINNGNVDQMTSLTIANTGGVTNNRSYTISGTLAVNNGSTFMLNSGITSTSTVLQIGGIIAGSATLTLAGDVTVNTTGSSSAQISRPVELGASTRTFTVADGSPAADLTVSGIISGSGGLTKAGAGTMVLTGANTYTGTTTVNSGALFINGSTAAGSAVTVTSGATLGGSGIAAGSVGLSGNVVPGSAAATVGTLSTGAFTFNNSSAYRFDISNVAGTAGTNWDLLNASGTINIAATSGSPITIFIAGSPTGFNACTPYSWTIAQGTSITNFAANTFAFNTSGFSPFSGVFSIEQSGNALNLVYTPQTPPIPTAGSNSPVCEGSTLNLTATNIAGAIYSWTGPNGFTSSLQNPSITNVTAAANGTYSVTATIAGCTSAAGTTSVTIRPAPQGTLTGTTICPGEPAVLTFTASSGTGPFTLVVNGVTYSNISSGVAFAVNPSPVTTSTYNLTSLTDANGCSRTSGFTGATAVITVNALGTWLGSVNRDWNNAANWSCGVVPTATTNVIINSTSNTPQLLSGADANVLSLTIASGASFEMGGGKQLTVAAAGTINNNGSFSAGDGIVRFAGAGTISGAFEFNQLHLAGAVAFSGGVRITGALRILANGAVTTNAPIYASGSVLNYNTGGTYNRSLEWSADGVGTIGTTPGYPHHVTITNSSFNINEVTTARALGGNLSIQPSGSFSLGGMQAAFTAGGILDVNGSFTGNTMSGLITTSGLTVAAGASFNMNSMSNAVQVNGNVEINGSLSLSTALGGDIRITGNWTVANNVTPVNNLRAVIFNGTGNQLATKTGNGNLFFDYLVLNKPGGNLQVANGTNIVINSTVGEVLQLLNAGALDLGSSTLTLNNTGGTIRANGTGRSITGSSGAVLRINGTKDINTTGGSLSFGSNVTVQLTAQMSFTAATTINGTLEILNNGSVPNGAAPFYASGSNLLYNTGTNRQIGFEWFENTFGNAPGVPHHVTVAQGSAVFVGNVGFRRELNGNLILNTPAAGASSFAMSNSSGGDLNIKGDIILLNSASFAPNSRLLEFNGTGNQSIQAPGTVALDFVTVNKAGGTLQLQTSVTINQTFALTQGSLQVNTHTLRLNALVTGGGTLLSAPTGTVRYARNGDQSVLGSTAYGNLVTEGSGIKTLLAAIIAAGDITIGASTTLDVTASSFALQAGGNWTNNGSFNGRSGTVTFTGAGNATLGGTVATGFFNFILNKGSDINSRLELLQNATVSGTGTDALLISSGLLYIPANRSFRRTSNGQSSIGATGGIDVDGGLFEHGTIISNSGAVTIRNNGNFSIAGNGGFSNTGSITLSSGTLFIGSSTGNNLTNTTGGTVTVSGGTLSVAGRFRSTSNTVISGGSILLNRVGSSNTTEGIFSMSASSNLQITDNPTINIQNINGGASPAPELQILAGGTKSITGGTFQIGNASTPANQTFRLSSAIALHNLVLAGPSTSTAQLAAPLTVNNNFELNAGALEVQSQTLTLNGSVTAADGTQLLSAAAGTVIYNQAAAGQNVLAANYGNLSFSNFSKLLPATGTIGVAGVFTPGTGSGHTITGSTFRFNGNGAQTLPAFTYFNLQATGDRSANSITLGSGTIAVAGNLNVAGLINVAGYVITGNTLLFNGSSPQEFIVPVFNLNNLTIGNSSSVTIVNPGAELNLAGDLTLAAGVFNANTTNLTLAAGNWLNNGGLFTRGGSTVRFTGGADQSIGGNTTNPQEFAHLVVDKPGGNLNLPAAVVRVNGNFTLQQGGINAASGSTLEFDGSTNQSVPPANFHHLVMKGVGTVKQATGNLAVNGTLNLEEADLAINAHTLTLNGGFSRGSGRGLVGSNASNLSINSTADPEIFFVSEQANNRSNYLRLLTLTAGASARLGNSVNLTDGANAGVLTVANTSTLTTNGNLTLKSDVAGTARVAEIVNHTAGTDPIVGEVVVERFIPARRSWRLITLPVVSNYTLRQQFTRQGPETDGTPAEFPDIWCIGNTTPVSTGFGTMLSGHSMSSCANSTAVGADWIVSGGSSSLRRYTYTNGVGSWNSATNTPNFNAPATEDGYLVFVRGDRSVLNTGSGDTRLRFKGTLRQGTENAAGIPQDAFGVVTNPFASPVNMDAAYNNSGNSTHFERNFWVWDANKVIPNGKFPGLGGYVTLSYGLNDQYACPDCPDGTNASNYLALNSGQALMVKRTQTSGTASLRFEESNKAATVGTIRPFGSTGGRVAAGAHADLRIQLFRGSGAQTEGFVDGTMARFHNGYSAATNEAFDVGKSNNFDENISLLRDNFYMAIESRPFPTSNDTLFVPFWNLANRNYTLQLEGTGFTQAGLVATLVDRFTGNRQQLPLSGSTHQYVFEVSADTTSRDLNRFFIVFTPLAAPLPVTFTQVRAYARSGGNQVEWSVASEENLSHYEVERSNNGRDFAPVHRQQPRNQGRAEGYEWLDRQPLSGTNFYRIRAVNGLGEFRFSAVVRVEPADRGTGIRVYPTLLAQPVVTLELRNQPAGAYNLELTNTLGQPLFRQRLVHGGGSQSLSVQLGATGDALPAGVYFLRISNEQGLQEVIRLQKQ